MCCFLATSSYYAFQLFVNGFVPQAALMSPWWYQLLSNILTALQMVLVAVYGLLFRRAQRDKAKWRNDVDSWFSKK